MSCTEIEKQIILFSELSIEDQDLVNIHVQECATCAKFYESQVRVNNLILQGASIQPEPRDPFSLTHNIMTAIKVQEQRRTKIFDLTSQSVQFGFARYAMAAVSVGLIIFLSAELLTPIQFENNTRQGTSESIVLNRKEFSEKLFDSKSLSSFSLASQCKSPFNSTKVNADCMRQKLGYQ